MLCESACHQLWSWEKVLFSSVSFVRLYFSDTAIFFTADFGIKNSASNFVLIFRKLLRKPTVCYRKPSEIMPWAKATFIMVQTLQGQTNVCRRRRWAFWTNVDKHNTGKLNKRSVGYPCRSWENYPQCLWDSRSVIRNRSTHFVGKLNMRRNSAWFAPRLLSDDQKAVRICVCRKLKQQARDDPSFISNIITDVELWVFGYEPETKQQASQWNSPNSPRPEKERQVRNNMKSLLTFFFDIEVIVYKDFVPPGQTINGKFYCEDMKRLREGIRHTRPDKLKKSNWFLQHDNAPAFTSFVVDNSWLPNHYSGSPPPYSPDIAPATFPIPQDEITDERASFSHDWRDPRRNARDYGHI